MASYFLHLFFFIGILIAFLGFKGLFGAAFFSYQNIGSLFFSFYGLGLAFFAEADALGRYQNYKQIKDTLYKRGFDTRLIRPFMYSKCQRDAVLVATKDLGYTEEAKAYFKKNGYRWYHILPDAFIQNPLVLFHRKFWTNILFTKRYVRQYFLW
ncbi:hypothetical protein [Namhaeicola litoreus]|uniref:Uncharacterized protein n=1 Tax=Namhaeicola litoreus TaxID=1052145 RepID=A0ABW3Y102_9FLAO